MFSAPYLWKHVHQSVPLIQATLFFNVMSNLFHAAFTDPGIVPPSNDKRTDEEEFYIRKEGETLFNTAPHVRVCVSLRYFEVYFTFSPSC